MSTSPARVISVTSGKGGVGKTLVSVNLGLALERMGKRVLLLDADLGLANINVVLGFQSKATLQDLVEDRATLKDIIVPYSPGFDIIPAASGVPEMTRLTDAQRMALVAAVDELGDVYDYLIVDTAAGIGENVMYFNVAAEEVLVVVDEEPTSITDAYAIIKVLAERHSIREFNIVTNRTSVGKDGRNTYAQLSAAAGKFLNARLKFLGSIQEDPSVVDAVKSQKPMLSLYPSSRASLDISKLAKKLVGSEGNRAPKGGVQFFFRSLLGNDSS